MKKNIFLLLLCGLSGTAKADNAVTTNDVVIRPGSTTELTVSLQNDANFNVYAYDFRLYLPEGVEVVKDGTYVYALSGRHTGHSANVQQTSDGAIQFGVSSPEAFLTGTDGPVIGIKLKADESLQVDKALQASITTITYANKEAQTVHPADITFDIKTSNRVVLDENALMVPDATNDNVDILVRRTIKANEWSTICLPFAMSVDKLKAAFGNDYELAYISGCEFEKDGDKVTGIEVNFTSRTAAAQINRPYIIKVSKDISEFEVNSATINPTDGYRTEVTEDDDETGEEVTICAMTGKLKSGTVVPAKSLFLSGNKFWYSTGNTKMKAYRGYFTFSDVLDNFYNSSRISLHFDGDETTGIGATLNEKEEMRNEKIFDLQGRRVASSSLKKGVYVKDGRKVAIKH